MSEHVLPKPDRASVGLDYVRVSYDVTGSVHGILDRYMRSRADVAATAMYGSTGTNVTLYQSAYGSGYKAGRHYSIVLRRDGSRLTEIASGIGARVWLPPARMVSASWRRLDVAIDYVYRASDAKPSPVDPVDLADGIVRRAAELLRENLHNRRITTIMSDSTTVYIGSRQSERFCRIYNKSSDLRRQRIDEPDAIVRVELELKSRGCDIISTDYIASGDVGAYVWGAAAYMTRTYRLPPLDCPIVPPVYNPRLDEPDEYRTLRWISDRVMPAIRRLVIAGLGNELASLGLRVTETGTALDREDVWTLYDEQGDEEQ